MIGWSSRSKPRPPPAAPALRRQPPPLPGSPTWTTEATTSASGRASTGTEPGTAASCVSSSQGFHSCSLCRRSSLVRPLQARHLELVCSASCSSQSLLPPSCISIHPLLLTCTIAPGTCRWRRAAPSSCASSRSPAVWPRSSPLSRGSCSASPGPARRDAPASPLVVLISA